MSVFASWASWIDAEFWRIFAVTCLPLVIWGLIVARNWNFVPREHSIKGRQEKRHHHKVKLDDLVAAASKLPTAEERIAFINAIAHENATKALAENPNARPLIFLGGAAETNKLVANVAGGAEAFKNSGVAETIGSAIRGPEKPATPVAPSSTAPAPATPMKPVPKK